MSSPMSLAVMPSRLFCRKKESMIWLPSSLEFSLMAVNSLLMSLVYCGTLIHLAMVLTVYGKCLLKKSFSMRVFNAGLNVGWDSSANSLRWVYTKEGDVVGSW